MQRWGSEAMDSRYANASRPEYLRAVGEAVLAMAERTPNGMLLFVASHAMLKRLMEAWRSSGLWARLGNAKQVFTEVSGQLPIDEYRLAAARGSGALYVGIYRGRLAEGIDFADADARCVICLGIPYPPFTDVLVKAKQDYNDLQKRGAGREWYTRQALTAVSQALGRTIRHRGDYGAIVLLDQAFAVQMGGLPKWVRDEVKPSGGEALLADMKGFFAAKA